MAERFTFNRLELAGSLGDLGTLLPIAIALILLNGLSATGLFLSIGLYYIASGIYFGITVPVQPMKVIGAYAIATAVSESQIAASSLLVAGFLFFVGITGAIDMIRKYTPHAVVRGIQLSTGVLLIASGIKFITGTSLFQELHHAVEPSLAIQSIGPVSVSLVLGVLGVLATIFFLENKSFPAGLIVVAGGLLAGLLLGARLDPADIGFDRHWPSFIPYGFPTGADFSFALLVLVLPQLPMTVGNAVLAYTSLSREYFAEKSSKVTNRNACLSIALANLLSFFLGGMPLCHGAGGLAAHYRFGARTAGSNIIIGSLFVFLVLLFGDNIVSVLNLIPLSILGVLLLFAGAQLAMTIMDLSTRKEFFVVMLMLGVTLASNLAFGFVAGLMTAWILKWNRFTV